MKKICSLLISKLSLMNVSGHAAKATMLGLLFLSFFSINDAKASHGQAAVSDIDHIGMGTFSGSYTHSTTDHVWIVFNANAGDVITINMNTAFSSYFWIYQSNTGCIQVGNSTANGCMTLKQQNGPFTTGSFTYTVTATGQYAIQLDSFVGGSGAYSVTVSGSTATTVLCTPSAPAFTTCPSNISSSLTSGCSMAVSYSAIASFGNLTFSKSGATTASGAGTGSGSSFNRGVTNVTITATNTCGAASTATCSFTVTVLDNLNPTITCPSNISVNATDPSGAVVTYTTPVGADNCPGATTVLTAGLASGSVFPIGPTTVTYMVTDASGNIAQCSFVVTVTCIAPAITNCPFTGYSQIYSDANSCSAAFSYNLNITGVPAPAVIYTFSGATTGSGTGTGSGSTFNVGQTTVTVTATNPCGTATCTFVITVIDNVLPVAVCKPLTVYLDANGTASIQPADINDGSYDNCGPVTLSFNSGIVCGTAVENQNVTITAPPGTVITSIEFASYGTPNGTCGNFTIGVCHAANSIAVVAPYLIGLNSGTIPATNGIFGDPCFGTVKRLFIQARYGTTSSQSNVFNCNNIGNNTVSLLVTDANGNVSSCNSTVTVVDNQIPVITCPSDIILCGSQQVNYNMPTATDNCSIVITQTAGLPSGSVFPVGTTVNSFTVTDPSGNSANCSFNITINPIPTVNTVASQTVCNNSATAAVTFTGLVPGTVFNWTNNTTSIGLAASGTGNIPSFTALNPTNAPVTATITVIPQFTSGGLTCTGLARVFTIRVNPTAIINPVLNKVVCYGAAAGSTIFTSPTTGGTIIYNWTNNTPAIGLAASGTGNIPNFIAKNSTNAPLVATITVTPSFGTAGNCSGTPRTFTITVNPTPNFDNAQYFSGILSASDPVYARPEQYNQGGICAVSVDPSAGSAVHYRTHTFTLAEPSNVVVSLLNSDGGLVVPTGNNINIDPFLQLVGPGGFNPASSCTNSIAANDDAGFLPQGRLSRIATTTPLAAGTYTVVVTTWENTPGVLPQTLNDLVLPWNYTLAVLTTSQTVCNNSATTALNFNTTVPGTVFNWTNNNTSIGLAANGSGSIPSFTAINTGINPVTATISVTPSYTNAGLTCFGAPVRYYITVNPTPTITCPGDQTASNIEGTCSAVVNYSNTATGTPTPAISYTFTGVTTGSGSGNGSGSSFNVGVTTVALTATNECGAPSCSFTVTVIDDEAPIITCNAPIEVSNDEGACGAVVNYVVTSTDNCPGQTVAQTAGLPSGSFFPKGTTTNTFVVTDASGNTATCSFTVKVNDTESPTITCNAPISVNNDLGVCGAAVSYSVTSSDNCSGQVVTQTAGLPSGSVFPVGVTTNSFLVTDASGNTATCSFTVTVTDNEKPVISVQNISRCFADDNFGCSINLGATATDNCQVISLTSNAPACFPVGTTTVTWTATDNHGNVSTKTQTVTRNPEININICAGPTRTIYTGTTSGVGPFGPQSVNLTSVVTGGTPGYSYKWTPSAGLNNALIANPVASPTVTTIYTLTVTDSKGCKRSLSITVNVLPLSAAVCSGSGNNVKFSVCHIPPGNPSNPNNICISVNALNAHLTSGSNGHNNCYLGPCQQNCFSTIPGAASFITRTQEVEEKVIVVEAPVIELQQPDFRVNVYPNPTAYDFSIQVLSKSNSPITIRILDLNGKVMSVGTAFSKGNNIKVGANLLGGTYIAEVIQGSNKQVVKLVKLN
jgi:large repetitive protein